MFLGDVVDVADVDRDTFGAELSIARQQRGYEFAHQIPPTSSRCSKRTISQVRVISLGRSLMSVLSITMPPVPPPTIAIRLSGTSTVGDTLDKGRGT